MSHVLTGLPINLFASGCLDHTGLFPPVDYPEFESGNYVPTDLRDRYDAFVHVDATEALHPLELHPDRERVPELYPVGL
jgi:hypothetical protein